MINSMSQYLIHIKESYGEQIAFQWIDNNANQVEKRTFSQFVEDIKRFYSYLKTTIENIEQKHIGLCSTNSYDAAVAIMGVLYSGATLIILNNNEESNILKKQIVYSDLDYVISNQLCMPFIQELISDLHVHSISLDEYSIYSAETEYIPETNLEKPALLIFTSGTSGEMKCVMHNLRSLFYSIDNVKNLIDDANASIDTQIHKFFMMLPFYHVMGCGELLALIFYGHQFNLCVDIRYISRDIVTMNSDYACVVPMIFNIWYKYLLHGHRDLLGNLKILLCGGAAISPEKVKVFSDAGLYIMNSYGLSETFGVGTHNVLQVSNKYNSIGKITSQDFQVKFEDDCEMCFKGSAVMIGYYKNEQSTKEAFIDDWFHTGDLGYMDEEGYIYITGRKKNLIILSSGENVSPEELESILMNSELVNEVMVFEEAGKICAEIYCATESQDEVRTYIYNVNLSLPLYKHITHIRFRNDPFPKTSTGKVKRK